LEKDFISVHFINQEMNDKTISVISNFSLKSIVTFNSGLLNFDNPIKKTIKVRKLTMEYILKKYKINCSILFPLKML
jgi:hypothetical protein